MSNSPKPLLRQEMAELPTYKAGKKVAPKYRDPANPAQTWTGRGRTPAWVQALQAAGQLATAEIKAE